MAAFPFHYYVTLRDEYIREMTPAPVKSDDDETVIDFNKDILHGEAV